MNEFASVFFFFTIHIGQKFACFDNVLKAPISIGNVVVMRCHILLIYYFYWARDWHAMKVSLRYKYTKPKVSVISSQYIPHTTS